MLALVALLVVIAPTPVPAQSSADGRYSAALERMRATREPLTAVYHAALTVPQGEILAQTLYGGALYLRFGQGDDGPSSEDFFVRTDRDRSEYLVELPDRHKTHSHLSLFNATWQGIDSWIRYGYEGDDSAPTATPTPASDSTPSNLRVISVVTSLGLAFYNASDGGTGRCANGGSGHVIRLTPRGDAMRHPLRSVTIDDTTGLFCTMQFDVPAVDTPPYAAIAHVALHLSDVDGYYLVQDETIEMVATAPMLADQHVRAALEFDSFVFPTPSPKP